MYKGEGGKYTDYIGKQRRGGTESFSNNNIFKKFKKIQFFTILNQNNKAKTQKMNKKKYPLRKILQQAGAELCQAQ